MATYASIAAWEGRTQPNGPELLAEIDLTAIATASLVGVTSLGGVTCATSVLSGSPAQWRTLSGSGVEIDDSGAGTVVGAIDFEFADIASYAGVTLSPADVLIAEVQWAAASSAPTVNGTEANIGFRPDSANHNSQTGLYKDATGNAIHYMFDGGNNFAFHGTISGVRSASIWLMPGGRVLNGHLSTSALPASTPLVEDQYWLSSDAAKSGSTVGPWLPDATNKIRVEVGKGSNETVPVYVESIRFWRLPGVTP